MKRFKIVLVASILLIVVFSFFNVYAEKPVELPRFQSGVMGEIFKGLAGTGGGQSIITSDELVGEWTCDAFAFPYVDSLITDDWSFAPENLFLHYLGSSITFVDDGDGSFSIITSGQDPFYLIETDPTATPTYTVVGDAIYRKVYYVYDGNTYSSIVSFNIERISQNIIIFKFMEGPQLTARVVVCERVLN